MILGTAFLLSLAGAAAAADAVVYNPVPEASGYNWSGAYVGAEVGYVVGGNADYLWETGVGTDADYNFTHGVDGIFGGIYAGHNYQFDGGLVVGAEADIVWGDVGGSSLAPGDASYLADTAIDWSGAARARLGYAMDRFLPYVAGGIAFAYLDYTEYEDGDFYSAGDANLVGWTLGIGAEYAITDDWLLRGEYRYTDYNDKDFLSVDHDEEFNFELDTHDVRLGAAYKF